MPKVYTYKGMHLTHAQLDRIITYAYERMLADKCLVPQGRGSRTVELPNI